METKPHFPKTRLSTKTPHLRNLNIPPPISFSRLRRYNIANHKFEDAGFRCLVYHYDDEGPCLQCRICGAWVRPSQIKGHGQDTLDKFTEEENK